MFIDMTLVQTVAVKHTECDSDEEVSSLAVKNFQTAPSHLSKLSKFSTKFDKTEKSWLVSKI